MIQKGEVKLDEEFVVLLLSDSMPLSFHAMIHQKTEQQ